MNDELKQIKKKYGERMMKLCRYYFPTILNDKGRLISILDSTFGHPKYIVDDIIEKKCISEFKDFIYYKYENQIAARKKSNKTPFELMKEAGYTLYECKSNSDIMGFKKYYSEGEELCTFKDQRLKTNYVFFAVKDSVDNIKREDFLDPKREDEYGTSVISIQFSHGNRNTLSIKNRYNHKVNHPDATFNNDLENIIPGLTKSFEHYYNFNINQNDPVDLGLEYVRASDGRYYKYNMEINNIYYCPDNIIIKNGKVIKDFIDKEKYLLIDYFILNLQNKDDKDICSKSISTCARNIQDCFDENLQDFDKININKNSDGSKTIELIKENQEPIYIKIDKCNNIIEYIDSNITEIGEDFLACNRKLNKISINNVTRIGSFFLHSNRKIRNLKIPNVIEIGNRFLENCTSIETLELDKVKKVGTTFLFWGDKLQLFWAPKLEEIGYDFLYFNDILESLVLPKTRIVGDSFLGENNSLSYIEMPNLEEIGNNFMNKNNKLISINFPKLEILKSGFLTNNRVLKKVSLPGVKAICNNCLECADVEELSLPNVKQIDNYFMDGNLHLKSIEMPELVRVRDRFLFRNKSLKSISFPKLEIIGHNFISENFSINSVDLPSCGTIGNNFLRNNIELEEILLPRVERIGSSFLYVNKRLNNLCMDNLIKVGSAFLYNNTLLEEISLPNLEDLEDEFLEMNDSLRKIYFPKLSWAPSTFYLKLQFDVNSKNDIVLGKETSKIMKLKR